MQPDEIVVVLNVFLDFRRKFIEKHLKRRKKAEKLFRPAFGCAQHPKAGQNTQQIVASALSKSTWPKSTRKYGTPCIGRNKSVLFNLTKHSVTLS